MIFDELYMAKRMHISWRADLIATAIQRAVAPRTALDLGCATGDIALGLHHRGVLAFGVDSSPAAGQCLPGAWFVQCDLAAPLAEQWSTRSGEWIVPRAELVIVLEVLPILDVVDRPRVLANAIACSRKWLLVNRLYEEEEQGLRENGWAPADSETQTLRAALEPWHTKQAIKALYLTGSLWRRSECVA